MRVAGKVKVDLSTLSIGPVALYELFRGFGVPVVKSALLLFVSVAPFPARIAARVALNAGVAPEPSY